MKTGNPRTISDNRLSGSSRSKNLAILAFHKIGEPPPGGWHTWNYVSASEFRETLHFLHRERWSVIDLETFLLAFENSSKLPNKSVLLTFDDGYRSMVRVTLPILLTFGYPAVVFVPTAFIGLHNSFDDGVEPEERICTWRDLLLLEDNGISIQSHGVSHRHFTDLHKAEQLEELLFSKELLESRLENRVEAFAFPYGDAGSDPSTTVDLVSGAGYRAAFLYGGGPVNLPSVDPYQITRVAMGPGTNLRILERMM